MLEVMQISGFWIKRILGQGLMPLGVSVFLSLWGVLLALAGRSKRAVAPFVLAALVLYAVSLDPVAAWIVAPLEYAYAPLQLDEAPLDNVRWIVVLGSGHHQDASLPALMRLDTVATARLAEALRVARRVPQARVLCTGGSPTGGVFHAQVLATAAKSLGLDAGRVAVENVSVDTPQQMAEVARRVGREPFVLVTSAIHMPRAVRLARAQGLSPIPAPAAYETFSPEGLPFLPYARNVLACHRALHEYLGLGWGWITGRLQL